jgi:hypothetical protein
MSTPVTYSPLRLDFGGVVPATVGPDISTFDGSLPSFRGGVEFASIPVGATVTVAVSGDTARFAVRDVFVLEWVLDYPDPGGDGPPPGHGGPPTHRPPPVRMLEISSQSDGSQPIRVEAGQVLLVRVKYTSLDRDGFFEGSLSITGDTWDPVEVPLTFFLTDISTLPLETLNIAQGNKASLPCLVRSRAGPPTHVSYRMSVTQLHNGLTMTPYDVIDLRAGESRPISIEFQAAVDAPLGPNDVAIDQITYFPHGLFIQVNIVRPLIVVNPAQPNTLRANTRRTAVNIAVFVGLSNGPATDVTFSMASGPPGLSMQARSFGIERDQVMNLSMYVDDPAPDDGDFTIAWTAVGGTQSGAMTFHLHIPRPITFRGEIDSGGLAALGGWYSLTINPDGSTRWQGHAHDSGLDGYDFAVSAVVRAPRSGTCVAFMHQGHVGGTVTSGSRDNDWDETTPLQGTSLFGHMSDALFDDLAQANHANSHVEYTSDIGEAVGSALGWLAKFAVGTVAGPIVGAVVFVGVEAWSFCATGSLIPGARIAEGILWLAGPENTLFALAAEELANLGSQSRELTQEEYDWANGMADGQAQKFAGCLPPKEDLLVTDIIGKDDRAFTFPRYDGKTMLNLGPNGFPDPRYCLVDAKHPKNGRGDVFVHELVHACQIQHVTLLSMASGAADNMLCAGAAGDPNAPYYYGDATDDYTTLNYEQQAMIVQDWYAGHIGNMRQQTGIPRDTASPFFHYITDNLRVGVF